MPSLNSGRKVGSLFGVPSALQASGDSGDDISEKSFIDHQHQYSSNFTTIEALSLSGNVLSGSTAVIYNIGNLVVMEGSIAYNNDLSANLNEPLFFLPEFFRPTVLLPPVDFYCSAIYGEGVILTLQTDYAVEITSINNTTAFDTLTVEVHRVRFVNHDLI